MQLRNEGVSTFTSEIGLTIHPNTTINLTESFLSRIRNSNDVCTALIKGELFIVDDDFKIEDPAPAISLLFGICIIVNTTNEEIEIADIGITVPANSLYRYSNKSLLRGSDDLLRNLSTGSLVINNGTRDLDVVAAIQLIHDQAQTLITDVITTDTANNQFHMLVTYDNVRQKFLSLDYQSLLSISSSVKTQDWLRFDYYLGDSQVSFPAQFNGTVVGVSANCTNILVDTQIYIYVDDIPHLLITSNNGVFGTNYGLNIDFSQGQRLRLRAGTADVTNLTTNVVLRWRS